MRLEDYKYIVMDIYNDGYQAGTTDIDKYAEAYAVVLYWIGRGRKPDIDRMFYSVFDNPEKYEEIRKEIEDFNNE